MKAPDFTLMDQHGTPHSLSQYRGKKVLLFFYPKDDTPGCTKEACSFRDAYEDLTSTGVQILGISCDDTISHAAFAKKFHLNFPILSDTDKTTVSAYGVWKPKKLFGNIFPGIHRESFLIDEAGTIVKHYQNVHPDTHVAQVRTDLGTRH